jgi:hypothetical protein
MDNTNNPDTNATPAAAPSASPVVTPPADNQPISAGGINQVPAGKKSNGAVIIIAILVGLIVCAAVVLFILAPWKKSDGGDKGSSDKGDSSSKEEAYDTKGNCKFYECLNGLTTDDTLEDVTEAFGFEPESVIDEEKKSETHTWTFDESHTIVMNVSTYSGKKTTVTIKLGEYVKDEIKQKGVTFDNVSEIKANLNKGDGVSYDEFKEYMGGVDGVLIEVGSWNKYEWRSTDAEGYMTGSFGASGKCMFMGGATY